MPAVASGARFVRFLATAAMQSGETGILLAVVIGPDLAEADPGGTPARLGERADSFLDSITELTQSNTCSIVVQWERR
jgi:hypothetical protein